MEFRHVTDEGVFLNDKEIYLGATSEAGGQGYQVLTPLREPAGRVVFVNRGYIPGELKDPAKRLAGQTRRHRARPGLAAAAAGRKAELVSARQPSRPELLVLGRSSGDERGGQARPGRAVLHRCRRDAQPRRLAEGRRHPAHAAEQPPAIRDHVVFPGGCVDRHLCPVSSPQRGDGMTAYQQLEERFRRIGRARASDLGAALGYRRDDAQRAGRRRAPSSSRRCA